MTPPIYKNFRTYFKKNFIYPEIREIFNPFLFEKHEMFEDIVDFINQTIVGNEMPGLSDSGTPVQQFDKGRTKEFQGGLPVKEHIDKELPITFNVADHYLNYMVLYTNMIKHLDHRSKSDKIFLPDIHTQILDDEDNIYLEFVYKNIKFDSLSKLSLSKQANGILNTQFTMNLKFNDIDIIFHSFKLQASRDSNSQEFDYINKIGQQE